MKIFPSRYMGEDEEPCLIMSFKQFDEFYTKIEESNEAAIDYLFPRDRKWVVEHDKELSPIDNKEKGIEWQKNKEEATD